MIPNPRILKMGFGLSALAGWAALTFSLAEASEAGSSVLLGYSTARLALAGVLLLAAAALSWATFQATRHKVWVERASGWLEGVAAKQGAFGSLVGGCLLALFVSWLLYFLPEARAAALLGSAALYIPRLAPLLGFLIVVGGAALVVLAAHRFGLNGGALRRDGAALKLAGVLFGVFLLLWALIGLTRLGLGFDLTEWNAPGAPLLANQVFLTVFLGLSICVLAGRFRLFREDRRLAGVVYGVAAIIWLLAEAAPNYYSSAAVPPNDMSYPLSDAFNHDVIANNVLIGEGFRFGGLQAVRKPLYALFLSVLHLFSEGDYAKLINYQVLILALFPVLLFFVARRLHSRLAGLLVAGFVIYRETNAILLGDVINLSHAKLLMADLPAALGLAALTLLVIHWLGHPERRHLALWAGGALGLLLLLRSQNLTLVPAIALLAVLALRSKKIAWRSVWLSVALLALGLALAAGPWLLRNRALTGQWIVEQSTAASYLAQRYSDVPESIETAFLPGESEGEYYARHMAQVSRYVRDNPGVVAGFVADNYMRNLYLTVMPLPLSLELRELESHVRELPYWPSWDGNLLPETLLPLAGNLALVALGIALAWRRGGWVGLAPLTVNLGFSLNLALARVSGWRYNQPVDWTLMLYYALGLAQILIWAFALLGRSGWLSMAEEAPTGAMKSPPRAWRRSLIAGGLILAMGVAPLAVEAFSTPRFQAIAREQAIDILLATDQADDAESAPKLIGMLEDNQLTPYIGSALYPRYLAAGAGNSDLVFALTAVQPFDRLTFYLAGPHPLTVVLPLAPLTHGPDSGEAVLVLACREDPRRAAAVIQLRDYPGLDHPRLYAENPAQACEL